MLSVGLRVLSNLIIYFVVATLAETTRMMRLVLMDARTSFPDISLGEITRMTHELSSMLQVIVRTMAHKF